MEGKTSQRAVLQAHIGLAGVRVPAASRLPGAGAFRDTTRVLSATRQGIAWEAVGHAMAAYEAALAYAKERVTFGKPIVSYQLVQAKLVGMLAERRVRRPGRAARRGSPRWRANRTRSRL